MQKTGENIQRSELASLPSRQPTKEEVEAISRTMNCYYEKIIHICTLVMRSMWAAAFVVSLIVALLLKTWWLACIGVAIAAASLIPAGLIRKCSKRNRLYEQGRFSVAEGYVHKVIPVEQDVIGETGAKFMSVAGALPETAFRVLYEGVFKNTKLLLAIPDNPSLQIRAFSPFMLTEDGAATQISWRAYYHEKQ